MSPELDCKTDGRIGPGRLTPARARRESMTNLIRSAKRRQINYAERAKFVRQFIKLSFSNRTKFNSAQKRVINRKYKEFIGFKNTHHVKVDARTRKKLANQGYITTEKGVLVDVPRDAEGNPLKGARVRITKQGVTRITVRDRTDTIIGIPPKERFNFADDPCQYVSKLEPSIRKLIRRKSNKTVVRLQFGPYASKSIFRPGNAICDDIYNYLHDDDDKPRDEVIDNLTGIRITTFLVRRKKRASKKKRRSRRNA